MKKIVLLLDNYPYSSGEFPFIKIELGYLLQNYKIEIVSMSPKTDIEMPLDERITLWRCPLRFKLEDKVKVIFRFIFSTIGISEIFRIIKAKEKVLPRIYDAIAFYGCGKRVEKFLKENVVLEDFQNTMVYSYWFNAGCLGALFLKKRYKKLKVISRIHGYDLYNERNIFGRQPFRNYMNKSIDRLFFIAENGKKYFFEHWQAKESEKYQVAYIGSECNVEQLNNTVSEKKQFTLVSCSNVIPLKRVQLIADALSLIDDLKIKWFHFGDGELLQELKEHAERKLGDKRNILYSIEGFCEHEEIISFYENNNIDCFITTSSTEGCPVSIQEAMSFGIPIIATAVGEIPNMINGNGELLKSTPTSEEISLALKNVLESDNTLFMRERSRQLWEVKFDAHKNAKNFMQEIERVFAS